MIRDRRAKRRERRDAMKRAMNDLEEDRALAREIEMQDEDDADFLEWLWEEDMRERRARMEDMEREYYARQDIGYDSYLEDWW